MTSSNNVNRIIVLVHGTWAKGAKWTCGDSRLYRELAKLSGTSIQTFDWSGKNRFDSRQKAAEDLRSYLNELSNVFDGKIFIVAHSHGGNISLMAADLEETRSRIAGIVFLATPFLHVRRRQTGVVAPMILANALLFPVAIALFLALWPVILYVLERPPDLEIVCLLIGVPLYLYGKLVYRFGRALNSQNNLQSVSNIFKPCLILRMIGDEASASISAMQFSGWLSTRAWSFVARSQPWLRSIKSLASAEFGWDTLRNSPRKRARCVGMFISLVMVVIGSLLVNATFMKLTWGIGFYGGVALMFLGAASLISGVDLLVLIRIVCLLTNSIAAGLLATITMALAAPFGLAVGPEMFLKNALFEVSAESTPIGASSVTVLAPDRSIPGLRHSSIYDDHRAVSLVVEWIESQSTTALLEESKSI